ncbi:SH3 domain-binding glutamic acid-rich-like protein 3 [Asterias rubens]|uniref:SH3 domain-binding glutamic acid-rich-like protein 3 n=1 Tax=Asterias rubens TaxID=7604 RepID=UPI00145543B1|nr:SH3 domain-binding glutamic acid-rich-like protein 3 [Asterias rubens]
MVIKFYFSTITSTLEMEKNQRKIDFVLSSKGYDLEKIDIATNQEAKHKMRELLNNPKALPPQIFNDDVHCGDFDAFDAAVENETLDEFLKL